MKNITHPTREFFIGVDISKDTFDAALMISDHRRQGDILKAQFKNNKTGLKEFDKWLKANRVARNEQAMLVIENTGLYHCLLWDYCSKHEIRIHIGNGAHLKWSFGIARGKNDQIDSVRLCNYCFKNVDELKLAPEPDPNILKLKVLIATRSRLVKNRGGHQAHLGEINSSLESAIYKMVKKELQLVIDCIEKAIKNIERKIQDLMKASHELSTHYKLLLSVPGIGPVTAAYLISCTNNFDTHPTGKQLACYAGIAPFSKESGTSIKGKARVHKMGNKELKRLLYMAVRSALQHNAEYKAYYDRKIAEGKPELFVVNALKNKIISRAAAVIRDSKAYVENYRPAA